MLRPLNDDLVNDKLALIKETGRSGPFTVDELKEELDESGGTLTAPLETRY